MGEAGTGKGESERTTLYPASINARLHSVYEELMWLANRPHVTPRQARAWYSQVLAVPLAAKVRRFSGMVSAQALREIDGRLVLEHFNRLSHSLSRLIERHLQEQRTDPEEFVSLVQRCEQVNITTDDENHRVQKTGGDYTQAGIELLAWAQIPISYQQRLWISRLKGKVINAAEFRPSPGA